MSEYAPLTAFAELARRVESIDAVGTRGVAVLAVQVQEVAKDVARLEKELESHRGEHRQAERDRLSGRRWLVGTAIAAVAAVDVPTLILVLTRGR